MTREIIMKHGHVVLVDNEDYDLVKDYTWHLSGRYAHAYIPGSGGGSRRRQIYMHNLILGYKGIDHKDRNTLNNQKANLRPVTDSLNQANKAHNNMSGYKGVNECSSVFRVNRFRATIMKDKKSYHLGNFFTAEEAAEAYNKKAKELFGEYALLNNIKENENV